jgi:hypothetical protein
VTGITKATKENLTSPYIHVIKVLLEPLVAESPGTGLKDRLKDHSDPLAAKYAKVLYLN